MVDYDIKYKLWDKVNIIDLNIIGKINSIEITITGIYYSVVYFNNGNRLQYSFLGDELEKVILDDNTKKTGFKN